VLGDLKYGSREAFSSGIALHARRLSFSHPVQAIGVELTAPLPSAWHKFGFAEAEES
jgi:23S rRNA pseudouridine1911/1915/1917 synthase